MPAEPTFSREQVEAILASAAQLDGGSPPELPDPDHLSLAQILDAAEEAGISRASVIAAATTLSAGLPTDSLQSQSIALEGTLAEEELQAIAAWLHTWPEPGAVTYLPGSVRWQTVSKEGRRQTLQVVVTPTNVTVMIGADRRSDGLMLAYVGAAVGTAAGLVIGLAVGALPLISAGTGAVIGVGSGLAAWRVAKRRWQARLHDLFRAATQQVSSRVARQMPPN
jgi:hypothetical protein